MLSLHKKLKKFFFYKAFGFTISSEIPLTKLHELKTSSGNNHLFVNKCDETIELNNVIFEKKNICIYNDGFIFQPGNLYFKYSHSKRTIFFKNSEHRLFEAYLLGPVIALVGAFHQMIPLHASGLVVRNKTLLILGNSGSGKSTLLYEILKKHKAFYFSDDIVFVNKHDSIIASVPSYSEIKLWQDAVERLSASKVSSIYHKISKYYVDDEKCFLYRNTIPSYLFFLQTSTQSPIKIDEISGSKKWLLLQTFIYRKQWIENAFQKQMFELISLLSNQCKAYKIIRPLNVSKSEWDKAFECLMNKIFYE